MGLVRPHGGWSQLAELRGWRVFAADHTHVCGRLVSQAMHAAAVHSHIIWRLPSADARSHSAHHLFRAMCMFSSSRPHTAALDSPNIKQSAYLHLYCVYQSGSHYSCEAAAINSRQQENGGRNSQLMIKKWQLASSFHSSRARLFVSWQIWTSKLKINHFLFRAATNYNNLFY